MKHTLAFLSLAILLACDPCPDCGKPLTSEPTVEMTFINQDSIDAIDKQLVILDSLDSSFTSVKALLVDFRDSLRQLNDSLELGLTEYQDERDAVLNVILDRQLDSTFLEMLEIADSISGFNATKSTINSGTIAISKIRFPEINDSLTFSENDSTTPWNFPLSFKKEFSIYEVLIQDETLIIELDYETFTEVDEERNVRIRAQNIRVVDTVGFDSLINCEQNCIDGTAAFTFYF